MLTLMVGLFNFTFSGVDSDLGFGLVRLKGLTSEGRMTSTMPVVTSWCFSPVVCLVVLWDFSLLDILSDNNCKYSFSSGSNLKRAKQDKQFYSHMRRQMHISTTILNTYAVTIE